MFKISELVAIDILDEKSIDVNLPQNIVHCYQSQFNNRINKQIIMSDTYSSVTNTRKYSSSSMWSNVLLGTTNFYPENGLDIPDYQENSKLQLLMSKPVLPALEMKKARMYFGQGLLGDVAIRGHWLRVYVKLDDDSEVTLCSLVDFRNDTNALAVPVKYFESQIFDEGIDFEFLDIDYLLTSENAEVNSVREEIFGLSKPMQYFFDYGAFTDAGVDEFVQNGYLFAKVSMSQVNQQSLLIDVGSDEVIASVRITDDKFSLISRLYNESYNITEYMNSKKKPEEAYSIEYAFTVNEYIGQNISNVQFQRIVSNDFEKQIYRPLLANSTEYAQVLVTIRVQNVNTGMVFRRDSSMIIVDDISQNFKALPSIKLDVTALSVNKVVNRTVNKVVQSSETPRVVQIEKNIYVQMQPLDSINLLEGTFVAKLNLSDTITGISTMYLKIGGLTFKNQIDGQAIFEISEYAYDERSNRYLLLDGSMRTIATGALTR